MYSTLLVKIWCQFLAPELLAKPIITHPQPTPPTHPARNPEWLWIRITAAPLHVAMITRRGGSWKYWHYFYRNVVWWNLSQMSKCNIYITIYIYIVIWNITKQFRLHIILTPYLWCPEMEMFSFWRNFRHCYTESCHFDNFRYSQWPKFHKSYISVSLYHQIYNLIKPTCYIKTKCQDNDYVFITLHVWYPITAINPQQLTV